MVVRAWLKQSCASFSVVFKYSLLLCHFVSEPCPSCCDVTVWGMWRQGERQRQTFVWTAECLNGDTKLRIYKCHICFVTISSSCKVSTPNKLFLRWYRCTVRSCSSGNKWHLSNAGFTFDVVKLTTAIQLIPRKSSWTVSQSYSIKWFSMELMLHQQNITDQWLVHTFCFYQIDIIRKCKNDTFESCGLLVFLFKSRFICQHVDPSWGMTAVIRGDTFLVD